MLGVEVRMAQLASVSVDSAGSAARDFEGEATKKRFEGSLAIGMQVTTIIHALHEVESTVRGERDLAALADAQEGLDMVCRQMRRTRTRRGLRAAD